MSQGLLLTPNGPGLAVRTGLNAAINRLATRGSGTARPIDIAVGEEWLETDNPGAGVWSLWQWDGSADLLKGFFDTVNHIFTAYAPTLAANSNTTLTASTAWVQRALANFTTIPIAAIVPTAADVAANGWFLCDGTAYNRTTYAALFAAIGTAYGTGNGSTTFNIPDLRGRFIAGADAMGGIAANRLGSGLTGGITGAATRGASGGTQSTPQLWTSGVPGQYGIVGGGPAAGGHNHYIDPFNNTPPTLVCNYMIYHG